LLALIALMFIVGLIFTGISLSWSTVERWWGTMNLRNVWRCTIERTDVIIISWPWELTRWAYVRLSMCLLPWLFDWLFWHKGGYNWPGLWLCEWLFADQSTSHLLRNIYSLCRLSMQHTREIYPDLSTTAVTQTVKHKRYRA
jgi:hypothetical protein